jgi:hypothetical protein
MYVVLFYDSWTTRCHFYRCFFPNYKLALWVRKHLLFVLKLWRGIYELWLLFPFIFCLHVVLQLDFLPSLWTFLLLRDNIIVFLLCPDFLQINLQEWFRLDRTTHLKRVFAKLREIYWQLFRRIVARLSCVFKRGFFHEFVWLYDVERASLKHHFRLLLLLKNLKRLRNRFWWASVERGVIVLSCSYIFVWVECLVFSVWLDGSLKVVS